MIRISFEAAYGITVKGNWDGHTVLQRASDDASLAARFKMDPESVSAKLTDCHSRLLTARAGRIRLGTDDKVLTSWNGLMLATLAEAARTLEVASLLPISDQQAGLQNKYYILATRNAEFRLNALHPNGNLKQSWREGKTGNEVFLEDYAALIISLLELYQTDFYIDHILVANDGIPHPLKDEITKSAVVRLQAKGMFHTTAIRKSAFTSGS